MNRITFYYYGVMLSFLVNDERLEMFGAVIEENGGTFVEVDRDVEVID